MKTLLTCPTYDFNEDTKCENVKHKMKF